MSERVGLTVKKPEVNRDNSDSRMQRTNHSQSVNPSVDRILFLQRTVGNQAVQRLMKSKALQAKLRIGQPGDVYEQEADRVADAVMRMPEPEMQRQVDEEEEEEILQTKPLVDQITPVVQRQVEEEEEEEMLQAKSREDATSEVPNDLESQINAIKGGGRPLEESERAYFEPRFGYDFGQVRMHTDTRAAETAQAVNAQAYTVGRDVVFGAGKYAPGTGEGRRLMAHELTHVVQQMGDSIQRKRAIDPPNNRFERELDGIGRTIMPVPVSIIDNLQNVSTEVGIQIQKYENTGEDDDQYVRLEIPDGEYVLDTANIPASVECRLSWSDYLTVYGTASQFEPRHIHGLDADPHELHNIHESGEDRVLHSTFRIKPGQDMERTPGQGSAKVQAFRHNILWDDAVLQAYLRFNTVPLIRSVRGRTTQVTPRALDMTPGRPNYVDLAGGAETGREETITHTVTVTNGYTLSTQWEITNTIGSEITSQLGAEGAGISAQIGSSVSAQTAVREAIGASLVEQIQRSRQRQIRRTYRLSGPGQFVIVPTAQVWQTPVSVHTYNEDSGRVTGREDRVIYTILYNSNLSIFRRLPNGQIDYNSVVSG